MNTKALQRIGTISGNAVRQILISLYNVAIPFLVLHFASKEIWGSFVGLLLFTMLALQVISWGSKEYQIRQFAQSPADISNNYSEVLATRWVWVLIFSIGVFFWLPIWQSIFVVLWIVGRYLAQSAESLVVFEKAFNAAIIIETLSFVGFCTTFWFLKEDFDLQLLIIAYSFYQLTRGILYTVYFRRFVSTGNFNWQPGFYNRAFPFFLLSVLGFLASKVDVYLIALMQDRIAAADYQIINSFLVFVMSLSAFVYAPFAKNIYRNSETVVHKTRKTLLLIGLIIIPVAIVAFACLVRYYLDLSFGLWFYLIAFAYVLPAFAYGIDIVNLFRLQKEKVVVAHLFIGAAANTLLSAAFIYSGFGIPGALTGSAIAQLIVLLLFKLRSRE